MSINLDNYEQWLLLYVDNELSAAERSAVEEFLVQYPYLQQELEILQQATLPVEDLFFDAKEGLLKPVLSEADREKMLLQLDNELPDAEKSILAKNIAGNKDLQTEWASLQKTQLNPADIIPFPDKQLLYKKEERPVISIAFIRWTAAAVIIGLGFWMISNFSNNNGSNQPEFVTNNPDSSNPSLKANPGNMATVDPADNNQAQNESADPVQQSTENISVKNNDVAVTNDEEKRTTDKQVGVNKKEAIENVRKNSSNDVAFVNENKKEIQQNNKNIAASDNRALPSSNDIAALPNKVSNNSIELSTEVSAPKKEIIDFDTRANRNAYAQTASYAFDENNNSVLMMEEEDITRSKAGIFLKKIKRNIERRANIKPGKSLKIAGFELAVK